MNPIHLGLVSWLLFAWTGLTLGGVAYARDEWRDIPGTSWRLYVSERSMDAQVLSLQQLGASLPSGMKATGLDLRLYLEPAPELESDLTRPHVLVTGRAQSKVLRLHIVNLEDRIDEWADRYPEEVIPDHAALAERMVQRQLIHVLTHKLDAVEEWSHESAWIRLSGWHGPRLRSSAQVEEPINFANHHGTQGSAEDLATLAEFFQPGVRVPGDPALSPTCRVRSKWFFLESKWGPRERPDSLCATLPRVQFSAQAVQDVEVVYIRSSTNHPASLVGHLLINVVFEADAKGHVRRDTYGLVAHPGERNTGSPKYMLRGLMGGFPSFVQPETYRAMMLRYAMVEDRDLYRLNMNLSKSEKERVLIRLDELQQGWHQPYLFFTRNCTQLPLELAETVLDRNLWMPRVFGPDAVLGRMERMGLVSPPQDQWVEEVSKSRRAEAATQLRTEDGRLLLEAQGEYSQELEHALGLMDDRTMEKRQAGYEVLAQVIPEIEADVPENLQVLERILTWSDIIEQAHRGPLASDGLGTGNPAIDSIWKARADLEARVEAGGVRVEPTAAQARLLHERVSVQTWPETTHTPLRGGAIASTWSPGGTEPVIGLRLATHLYKTRLGESRRYTVPSGVSAHVLDWQMELDLESLERLSMRLNTVWFQRIYGARRVANPGGYVRLLGLERELLADDFFRMNWLETGAVVELVQADEHRHHALIMAGVSVQSDRDVGEGYGQNWSTGLGFPLRAEARIGGRRHPLTGLRMQGELWLEPGPGDWVGTRAWQLDAGLRLGDVAGVEWSVFAAVEERVLNPITAEQPQVADLFLIGLRLEPF